MQCGDVCKMKVKVDVFPCVLSGYGERGAQVWGVGVCDESTAGVHTPPPSG